MVASVVTGFTTTNGVLSTLLDAEVVVDVFEGNTLAYVGSTGKHNLCSEHASTIPEKQLHTNTFTQKYTHTPTQTHKDKFKRSAHTQAIKVVATVFR